MASVNKAIILGNLGRDPEIRYTQSGTAVCNFSVATTYKPKKGEEVTEWHNIIAWDRLAEICGEYLTKGSQVYIEGRLQTSSWEKDGVKKYKTEIVAFEMKMLGQGQGKKNDQGQRSNQQSQGQRQNRNNQPPEDDDSGIPF
jgi:single-strand DNA-binding protein